MKHNYPSEQYFDDLDKGLFFLMLFQFFAGVTLFISLLYSQRSFAIFSLIILILSFTLRIWSRMSSKDIYYSVKVDNNKIFPGDIVNLKINIENNKLLPVIIKLRLNIAKLLTLPRSDTIITETSGLLWHQNISIRNELRPQKRGFYKIGSPRLVTGDFFGFFPRIKKIHQKADILVYPRLVQLTPFSTIKKIMFGKPASASPIQDPIYILGTRND